MSVSEESTHQIPFPRATHTLVSPDVFSAILTLQLAVCLFLFLADMDAVYSGMQVSEDKDRTCIYFLFCWIFTYAHSTSYRYGHTGNELTGLTLPGHLFQISVSSIQQGLDWWGSPPLQTAMGRRKSALFLAELFFLTKKHNSTECGFACRRLQLSGIFELWMLICWCLSQGQWWCEAAACHGESGISLSKSLWQGITVTAYGLLHACHRESISQPLQSLGTDANLGRALKLNCCSCLFQQFLCTPVIWRVYVLLMLLVTFCVSFFTEVSAFIYSLFPAVSGICSGLSSSVSSHILPAEAQTCFFSFFLLFPY